MRELKESDFIIGNKDNIRDALLISEECNGFIDYVVDKIYSLNLTPEEENELGLEIHREKYDDSWKFVRFSFGPGNVVTFSKREARHSIGSDHKVYRTEHELRCDGQLNGDRMISKLSNFGIVGSHTLFSYNEECEILDFDEGTEKKIRITDMEKQSTQYSKLGLKKKIVYRPQYDRYSYDYLDRNSYKEKSYEGEDGKWKHSYFDLKGNPLVQPELIATSFDSFDNAYDAFKTKFEKCKEIIDSRLEEITNKKTR